MYRATTVAALVAFLASFALASFALAGGAAADEFIERLPVGDTGTLHVVLQRGDVRISTHDEREVWIEARARGLGSSNVHFAARSEPGDVILTGSDEPWLRFIHPGPRVDVQVLVPAGFAIEIQTARGVVEVEGVRGGVVARTTGAPIRLVDVEGPVKLRTAQGVIETRRRTDGVVALTLTDTGQVYREHGRARPSARVPALGLQAARP